MKAQADIRLKGFEQDGEDEGAENGHQETGRRASASNVKAEGDAEEEEGEDEEEDEEEEEEDEEDEDAVSVGDLALLSWFAFV